jgi:hypothetical protein
VPTPQKINPVVEQALVACSPTASRRNKQILLQHKQDACSGQLMFKMHLYWYLMVKAIRVKK